MQILPELLLAVGLLISAIVILALVLGAIRKRTMTPGRAMAEMGHFEQLRRLRERGEISEDEFDRIRRRAIDRMKNAGETPATPRTNAGETWVDKQDGCPTRDADETPRHPE